MSEHYVKVNDVETVESNNSTALIVLVVSILALVILGLVFWQPWATPVQSNSTTVIRENKTEKQVPGPSDSRPIIVNPPASSPGNTSVNIHNDAPAKVEPPKTESPAESANTESNNSN